MRSARWSRLHATAKFQSASRGPSRNAAHARALATRMRNPTGCRTNPEAKLRIPRMMAAASPPSQCRRRSARSAAPYLARLTAAVVLAVTAAATLAQDPQRGRDLYLNAAAIKGTPLRSCVQCHGLPPDTKLKGASVAQLYGAFASVNEMSGFITAFTQTDVADLSAFLADPSATPTPLPAIDPLVLRLAAPLAVSSPAVLVALRNDGAAPLRLAADAIQISGVDADAFQISASTCAPQALLPPNGLCQFELRFTPQQARTSVGQIVVRYDTIAQPTSVGVSGEPQPRARFTYSAAGIAFGARPLGEPASRQSVRVINAGTVPLAVAERRLDGAAAADFALQGCAVGSVLAPGATCRLDVDFTPSAAGASSATLTLASPDAVEPMTLTLSGAGQVAVAGPSPVPPASPTPPPAGSTANVGGGGAISRVVLFALLFAAAQRWRNRHVSPHPG